MADSINNGGTAFPATLGPPNEFAPGMSIRDWFAGQALVGLLSFSGEGFTSAIGTPLEMGAAAYQFADAMLAAQKAGA